MEIDVSSLADTAVPVTTVSPAGSLLTYPLLLVVAVLLACVVVYGGVLYYHWTSFSLTRRGTILTIGAYVLLTIPLLLLMTSAALSL